MLFLFYLVNIWVNCTNNTISKKTKHFPPKTTWRAHNANLSCEVPITSAGILFSFFPICNEWRSTGYIQYSTNHHFFYRGSKKVGIFTIYDAEVIQKRHKYTNCYRGVFLFPYGNAIPCHTPPSSIYESLPSVDCRYSGSSSLKDALCTYVKYCRIDRLNVGPLLMMTVSCGSTVNFLEG